MDAPEIAKRVPLITEIEITKEEVQLAKWVKGQRGKRKHLGATETLIVGSVLVLSPDKPAYHQIENQFAEWSQAPMTRGALVTMLSRLENKGMLACEMVRPPMVGRSGQQLQPRRRYSVTHEGLNEFRRSVVRFAHWFIATRDSRQLHRWAWQDWEPYGK
jgi:hypothetical protein